MKKEKPSPGTRKPYVLSRKKFGAALLMMAVLALSFAGLFTSVSKTYAASSTPAIVTPTGRLNSPSVTLSVTQGNPSSLHQNESLILVASPQNFFSQTVTEVDFYFSSGGSSPTLIGTDLSSSTNAYYGMSWSSPTPGTYSLTAVAQGVVSNSITATVVAGTPPPFSIVLTSPANGSVYTLPNQYTVVLSSQLNGLVIPSGVQPTYTINYAITLEPNGPVFNVGTVSKITGTAPGDLTFDWYPPYPSPSGTFTVVATIAFSSGSGGQSATSTTITVHTNIQACQVNYQLESQVPGSFSANVGITNTGTVPINGWTLAFSFSGDQKITQIWNASYTQTVEPVGELVNVTNLTSNTVIAPGGTVTFWFNGSWANNNTSPIDFALNGIGCSDAPQGSPTPQPSPSPQVSPTVQPSPQVSPTSPLSACRVSYQLESQWAGGLNVSIAVTNLGGASINGWTLAFTFPGDQKITQIWNASYTQTGRQVSITNLSYNSSIAPGSTITLGFNGSWVSNDSNPTAFTLNGSPCSPT